jgi:protein O-GlcNAc transferase
MLAETTPLQHEGGAPEPAPHAVRGMALLAEGRAEEARAALRAATAAGDCRPETWLNLALAEAGAGDTDRALALIHNLQETQPDWDEPWLREAETLRAAGRSDPAVHAYEVTLQKNPRRVEALLGLAVFKLQRQDGFGAQKLTLRCCGIAPGHAQAWDALGLSLLLTGDHAAASAAFAEALRLGPHVLDYALHRADASLACGNAEAELARLEVAAFTDPLDPVAPTARGILLERLGRREDAICALQAATALAPDAPRPAAILGSLLARSHRGREAERALAHAIALDPGNSQLQNDRATVLMRLHRHAEAKQALETLIARDGPDVTTLCNLANVTVSLGQQDQAIAIARRAIALAPQAHLPWRALCNTLPYHEAIGGAALLTALGQCAALLPRPQEPSLSNTPEASRRLRIGLLSGSLRTHPVGWLTIAGLETLDPQSFELICLGHDAAPDPIALRFRAIASAWHATDGLDDAALCQFTRRLGIDILIDLGGYGDTGRLPACSRRLAPVQIKWVGMQNHSTGLPEMDWFITDRWETPPGLELFYTERLLRLQDGYVCYSPPPYAPDIGGLPAEVNGHITFGCFNNLAKITPTVIATWSSILRLVPNARMALKTHQFADQPTCDRLLAAFAAHGIAPDRLTLQGASSHRAFLNEYNGIDMVLDPFPYSGGLTTCEALWMGVPTLTLPGETFASRHSASHMSNAGLDDWIATDLTHYIDLAVAKSGDRTALAALRAGLRARVKAGPLCDAPRFGRNLGHALRHAWRHWCDNAAPDAP